MAWRVVYYPEGGFEEGWQARQATQQATPYEINIQTGTVRRQDGLFGEYVQANTLPGGYNQILLRVPERKCILVHNLVCWVAHGPRPHGMASVDHRDRKKTNNNADNLRWASHKEQNQNRQFKGGRIPTLPFEPMDDEILYDFRGMNGEAYTGTKLQFTSQGRILREGRVSPIKINEGQYPRIAVSGLGGKKQWHLVHVHVWAAVHGPDQDIPEVVNHKDHDPTNFRPDNLEASDHSQNIRAAHDAGRFDHTRSKRKRSS